MQYHPLHSILSMCFFHQLLFFMKSRCSLETVGGRKFTQRVLFYRGATSMFASFFSYFTVNLFPLLMTHKSGRQPFERRHTVPQSFQLNATSGVEVAMMFRDDSSEVMMLYDTNCSATVVRPSQSAWPRCSCYLKPSCSPWKTASLTSA